jgi:hypothetical protein
MLQFALFSTALAQVIPITSLQLPSMPTVTMPPVSVPTITTNPVVEEASPFVKEFVNPSDPLISQVSQDQFSRWDGTYKAAAISCSNSTSAQCLTYCTSTVTTTARVESGKNPYKVNIVSGATGTAPAGCECNQAGKPMIFFEASAPFHAMNVVGLYIKLNTANTSYVVGAYNQGPRREHCMALMKKSSATISSSATVALVVALFSLLY